MAWKHSLSSEQIGEEWLKQTFLPVTGAQTDTPAGEVIQKEQIDAQLSLLNSQVLQKSREAVVDYMMPLGLHHIFAWGHHYGPTIAMCSFAPIVAVMGLAKRTSGLRDSSGKDPDQIGRAHV